MTDEKHERGVFRAQHRAPDGSEEVIVIDRYGRCLARVTVPDRAREGGVTRAMRMLLDALDPGPAAGNAPSPGDMGDERAEARYGDGDSGARYGCLVLDREGEYDSGTRFRVWRFVEDRPEIPAAGRAVNDPTGRSRSVEGPTHAAEGDELWEEPDRLTPWKLKRDGVRIGSPEHWQVREAFGGELPPWGDLDGGERKAPDEGGGGDSDAREAHRYVSTLRENGLPFDGDYRHRTKSHRHGLYRFRQPVPPVGAEEGDVLIYAYEPESRPEAARGVTRGLDPEEIEGLREYIRKETGDHALRCCVPPFFENLLGGDRTLIGYEDDILGWLNRGLAHLLADKRRWGTRLQEFYHRLFLLRPAREEVTTPIRAPTDEGAIFELISDAGGRMPGD